ncbi:MAG TPA: hypothetical protein VF518_00760 [Polyangia bacterium]
MSNEGPRRKGVILRWEANRSGRAKAGAGFVRIEKQEVAMPGNSTEERLAEVLAQCVADLLSELKIKADRHAGSRPPPTTGESIAAFSGFGSTSFRGSFTLFGSSKLFSRLHPLPPTVTPRDLVDWACELVNQSVGRFRNRLLGYGVSVALGVPQSALAEQMRLSSSLRPGRTPICFTIDGMILEGWLELSLKSGFELAESPSDAQEAALREGSMVFF